MSVFTPTATTIAGLSPVRWRVVNYLFYGGTGGINLHTLADSQGARKDDFVALEEAGLVTASLGRTEVRLVDVHTNVSIRAAVVRVRLTPAGRRKVSTVPANQVICMLGGRADYTARARDVRTEAMVDDANLLLMDSGRLINATLGRTPAPLAAFGGHPIPDSVLVHLSTKGRQFYPR